MTTYYKLKETRHPNIYEYNTKKGKLYAVRIGYTHQGQPKEFEKRGLKTIAAAKSLLRDIEDKIENYETGLVGNKNITVREYYPKFVQDKLNSKSWNKQSRTGYDSNFNNHILPVYGDMSIIKIDRVHYQEFINHKLDVEDYSPQSVRSINNAFMAFLNHAVDVGVIERNRLKRVIITKSDYQPKKKHLSVDEYHTFMEIAEETLTDKMKFAMVYLTTFGLRRGEIMGLTPRYISFGPDGRVWLEIKRTRTLEHPEGKGPKTPSSERTIVIDDKGTDLVRYVLDESAEIKKDFGEILHQDDFLFINQQTGEPYYVGYLNVLMEKVSRASGIKCSPHMMRHTFTTIMRTSEADPRLLADFLGHKNTSITDHYSHKTTSGMEKIIDLSSREMH